MSESIENATTKMRKKKKQPSFIYTFEDLDDYQPHISV